MSCGGGGRAYRSGPGMPNRRELLRQHREVADALYPRKPDLEETAFATVFCCGLGCLIGGMVLAGPCVVA